MFAGVAKILEDYEIESYSLTKYGDPGDDIDCPCEVKINEMYIAPIWCDLNKAWIWHYTDDRVQFDLGTTSFKTAMGIVYDYFIKPKKRIKSLERQLAETKASVVESAGGPGDRSSAFVTMYPNQPNEKRFVSVEKPNEEN